MRIIIIGGGQVGSYLATLLLSNGHEVCVIESREKVYKKLEKELPTDSIILGNGSDPEILKEAGILSSEAVAAVTGADEINLVVSTLAKMEFNVPRVVARINNPRNSWLFNSGMGVDVCVNQADLMAHLVVEEMDLKGMFTLLKLSRGEYSIVQMKVGENSGAAGRYVKDLPIPKKTVLIAINHGKSLLIPKGDTLISANDGILALADESTRKELNELFG